MKLYHRTTPRLAAAIRRDGFAHPVILTNRPPYHATALLIVEIPEMIVEEHERPTRNGVREFVVPAAIVNRVRVVLAYAAKERA